ncbi:hypothetical protein RM616_09460 [Mammaliicoccus sciuri]|uniref:hypothetical protein n=1 Tax=Mammaliicoccus sciuri TaxID=1296 RepID=UPI000D1EA62E|nr:hypothetical protein [Mammaliicoccus sciuri]MDT0669802.1 hypothetical protein [Mammaliicoccus sciuri]PTJ52509.1 hypothetical protein BU012_04755 [Mammaliicoccus sciuri]
MDTITNLVQDWSPGVKVLVTAFIGLVAIFFVGKTGFSTIKAFSNKQIGEGMIFLAITVGIIVISIILFTGIWGLATNVGKDFESELGMVAPFLNMR